jgi:hypothetical protein
MSFKIRKISLGLTILLSLLFLSACSRIQPIENVNGQKVPSGLSAKQVSSAIFQACNYREWNCSEISSNEIKASYTSHGHTAVVSVKYNADMYSINYVSSENLMEQNGKINRNYNRWVNNLNHDIQSYLSKELAK